MYTQQSRRERIKHRFHQIRDLANKHSHKKLRKLVNEQMALRKLFKLDCGDSILVTTMMDNIYYDLLVGAPLMEIYQRLWRVFLIGESGCSIVLESLEYYGADLAAPV
jgi:hypothetical protein